MVLGSGGTRMDGGVLVLLLVLKIGGKGELSAFFDVERMVEVSVSMSKDNRVCIDGATRS